MKEMLPCLWFIDQAEEAVRLYTSLFRKTGIGEITRYSKTAAEVAQRPAGSLMTIKFELEGQPFIALNGGPVFRFTPAVSFFVILEDTQAIDRIWNKLSEGGDVLMELAKYPFAEKYGWLTDKYGVAWQLMAGSRMQKIAPCLMFVGKQSGKAEKAMNYYASIFPNSKVNMVSRYGKGGQDPEGTVNHGEFSLNSHEFMAMDSALKHAFTFSEAISFMVTCENQKEVDFFWEKLTSGGEPSQCGWLKDQFGVSWQIVPTVLNELMIDPDPVKASRVTQAMLQMKKIDINGLKRAYEGR
jgi:predicted 3-demethylubiquinone-9 3-methyltransferase (glyoxalase superfamily)